MHGPNLHWDPPKCYLQNKTHTTTNLIFGTTTVHHLSISVSRSRFLKQTLYSDLNKHNNTTLYTQLTFRTGDTQVSTLSWHTMEVSDSALNMASVESGSYSLKLPQVYNISQVTSLRFTEDTSGITMIFSSTTTCTT